MTQTECNFYCFIHYKASTLMSASARSVILSPHDPAVLGGHALSEALSLIRDTALFDDTYYVAAYGGIDPMILRVDPASHYLAIGCAKGYQPSKSFDGELYGLRNTDVIMTGINPLLHLAISRQGRQDPSEVSAGPPYGGRIFPDPPHSKRRRDKDLGVDIIVVADGYDATLDTIHSVLTTPNSARANLILIDDCQRNGVLADALKSLSERSLITLFQNDRPVGFARAVNSVLKLHPNRDIILLGSGMILPSNWLDRLMSHRAPDVASITPFSNTISPCGYPRPFTTTNSLPRDPRSLDMLASLFNKGLAVNIAFGAKSCILITRHAISKIGYFDHQNFDGGDGAVIDYCYRAAKADFRNLQALDVFVQRQDHDAKQDEPDATDNIHKALRRKHPDFPMTMRSFIAEDPASGGRQALDFAIICGPATERRVLCFEPAPSFKTVAHPPSRDGERLTIVRPGPTQDTVTISSASDPALTVKLISSAKLIELSCLCGFDRIEVHGLSGFPSTLMNSIRKLSKLMGAPYEFYVNDFAAVCPRQTLIHARGVYCGEKGEKQCTLCLADKDRPPPVLHPDLSPDANVSISRWRKLYERFLSNADRVACPSLDTEQRIRRHFPGATTELTRAQALSAGLRTIRRPHGNRDLGPLNIAVIGCHSYGAGRDFLERCAQDALIRDLPVVFHLTDRACEGYLSMLPNIRAHVSNGSGYAELEVDGVLLPALQPEPDCPELRNAINSEIPSFAFKLGAQNEVLRRSSFGHPIPIQSMDSPAAVNDVLVKTLGADQRQPVSQYSGLAEKMSFVRPHFDVEFYARQVANLKPGTDALLHYFLVGWRDGLDPSPAFSTMYYLRSNPDVANSGLNPFWHYLIAGKGEGRDPVHPGGYKVALLSSLAPLPQLKQTPAANAGDLLTQARICEMLGGAGKPGSPFLTIVFGHDDYRRVSGGVQLCIQLEERQAHERGEQYLNIFPRQHLQTMLDDKNYLVELVLDGRKLGTTKAATLANALHALKRSEGSTRIIIHHLLGHRIESVRDVIAAVRCVECWLWIHDYFTICPSYTLSRNGITYCKAPPRDSNACSICRYGAERLRHHERLLAFFKAVRVRVLSPSQFTKDLWLSRSELPAATVDVLPHVELVATPVKQRRRPVRNVVCRVAFAGTAAAHKGWPMFERLYKHLTGRGHFEFYYFGQSSAPPPGMRNIPVHVTADSPSAMIKALAANEIDLVVHWAIGPETFSFSTCEAMASGAYVVANTISGNVAELIKSTGRGIVLDGDEKLMSFFEGGGAMKLAVDARRRRSTEHLHYRMSSMTYAVLGGT
ncbi:glycosyltransferase [Aestuariivirga sp.]|uniref:glycosyltransferase n=1 Tax=Aestuariivirga sp. TaxID=2650926 RepID=UPI0037834500